MILLSFAHPDIDFDQYPTKLFFYVSKERHGFGSPKTRWVGGFNADQPIRSESTQTIPC